MLIRELVRRTASDDELVTAVYDSPKFTDLRSKRLFALLSYPPVRETLYQRRQLLLKLLDKSRRADKDCGYNTCAQYVFLALARDGLADFQNVALEYAASALVPARALTYLGRVGASTETLNAVRNIAVPVKDAYSKEWAIRSITGQIESGKKRTGATIGPKPQTR